MIFVDEIARSIPKIHKMDEIVKRWMNVFIIIRVWLHHLRNKVTAFHLCVYETNTGFHSLGVGKRNPYIHPSIQSSIYEPIHFWRNHPSIWLVLTLLAKISSVYPSALLPKPSPSPSPSPAILFLPCLPGSPLSQFVPSSTMPHSGVLKLIFPLRCRVERAFPTCRPSS